LLLGREGYLAAAKAKFERGILSAKEYRTAREFVRDWDANKRKYVIEPSAHEAEYRKKLLNIFSVLKI